MISQKTMTVKNVSQDEVQEVIRMQDNEEKKDRENFTITIQNRHDMEYGRFVVGKEYKVSIFEKGKSVVVEKV